MKDELDDIKKMWQQAKESNQHIPAADINTLIASGEAKKKSALAAHYGNAVILSITLAVLIFYFYYFRCDVVADNSSIWQMLSRHRLGNYNLFCLVVPV